MRLALFDLDNTLIDRQAVFERWARSFVEQHELGQDAVGIILEADQDGFATREAVFGTVVARYALASSIDDLTEQYRQHYLELFEPDETVQAALGRLRSDGWRIGIVTNGPRTQREKIRRAGLEEFIDGCCVSAEIGVEKPDARIFAEAARRCGRDGSLADGAWVIGDEASTDIAGGRGCGMKTIWLHRGRVWRSGNPGPDLMADSVPDAVELLLSCPT
jgi:HAD superfamily hydrolase (TIGR01549 family)